MITLIKNSYIKSINEDWETNPYLGEFIDDRGLIEFLLSTPFNQKKEYLPGIEMLKFRDLTGPRKEDNVDYINSNWLVLDIEESITIAEFRDFFDKYEYYLHTSTSHRTEKKHGSDCFRVFIPGDFSNIKFNIHDYDERKLYNDFMLSLFPFEIDPASFQVNRLFYPPSTINGNYSWFHNEGAEYKIPMIGWRTACLKHQNNMLRKKSVEALKKMHKSNYEQIDFPKIDTMAMWMKCNKSGCVRDFMNNYSSSNYTTGGQTMLYKVLCSAKELDVDDHLIDEIHSIQKRWSRQNTRQVWNNQKKAAGL